MSLALLSILPQDVAQQVNGYTIQLSVTQRLANGWKEIHEELTGGAVNSNWIRIPDVSIIPSAMLELFAIERELMSAKDSEPRGGRKARFRKLVYYRHRR